MNVPVENPMVRFLISKMQRYNAKKYWKMREQVVNPNSKTPKLLRYFYLYRIKRSDAFNNASMGTDMGKGAVFASPPHLPHGLNGIIISHTARIGKNVTIYQQVTIMHGRDGMPVIGDNCMIGAGAKILPKVRIGDNVKIGANAVVTKDVPSNCTAVGVPATVLHPKKPSGD
jgi:serine O-acetyltransferase